MNKLYYQYPGTWFGDCMPYGKGNEFYLFHQRDNRNPGPFGEPFGWDLATTSDFVNYKELSLDEAARWVRQEKRKWQTIRLINPDENREIAAFGVSFPSIYTIIAVLRVLTRAGEENRIGKGKFL